MKQYYIQYTETMGRGIFANKSLQKGDVVMTCELIVLSSIDTVKIEYTDLRHYTFKYNEAQDCLVLGDGSLFNHAITIEPPDGDIVYEPVRGVLTANIAYHLEEFFGRKRMVFTALTDIIEQTQLFIDYSTCGVNTDCGSYVSSKSLMG